MRPYFFASVIIVLSSAVAPASQAQRVTVDRQGRVAFADATRGRIWRLDPSGGLSSFHVGPHLSVLVAVGDWLDVLAYQIPDQMRWIWRRVLPDGRITEVNRPTPIPMTGKGLVAADSLGNLYFLSLTELLRLAPDASVRVWVRPVSTSSASAGAFGPDGSLYVLDSNSVVRMTRGEPAGSMTAVAGTLAPGVADGAGTAARFDQPMGVAVDSAANLYVADYGNRSLRKISPTGTVTTLLHAPAGFAPTAVAVHGDAVYLLEESIRVSPNPGRQRPIFPLVADLVGTPRLLRVEAGGKTTTLVVVRGWVSIGLTAALVIGGLLLLARRLRRAR